VSQIVTALSNIANPWAVISIASIGALGYSLKQLLQWPRPAEVDRLKKTNINLRATVKEQRTKLDNMDERREDMRVENIKLKHGIDDPNDPASS
jgi:hypothetical protein